MEEQQKFLDMLITKWMGDASNQVDDMLILGFKI